jgi:hypothetical protein
VLQLSLIIILILNSFSLIYATEPIEIMDTPLSSSIQKKLIKNIIFSETEVESLPNNQQKLIFHLAGLHLKSCKIALTKLSKYENYEKYLDMVKKSYYNEKTQILKFFLQAYILPFKMILEFKLPRIIKPGLYHFQFLKGFLKGLKGEIHVSQYKNRCFFYSTAKWKGPDSGIFDFIFEFFASTLSKMSMEKLFIISSS